MPIVWNYSLGGSSTGSSGSSGSGSDNATTGPQVAEFALDPVTGDLRFPPVIIFGGEAVAQRVRVRFKWFLGEWFLDQRLGVPYFQDILIKNPDPILISFIFKKVLTTTPGVASVSTFNATLDAATRTLTVSFEATLDSGGLLTAAAVPFIIDA